jgi:glycosyltransferase involved in cell wall biosynthesis
MEKIKNKIGVLILSNDSEKYIKKTINSVKNLVDQIVVVDSGSEDSTPNICSRLGAEVYFRKWTNDFSEQRNFALKHFRTDWILMLDSDEELAEFNFNKFNEIINNPKAGGVNFKIINLLENGKIRTTHRYTRLFKRLNNIFFSGSIHEQVRESIISSGYEIIETEFSIIHYGYLEKNESKMQRNIELLEKEYKLNKDDDWVKYHLANSYFTADKNDEAEKIYYEILDSDSLSDLQKDTCKTRMAQIALKSNLYDKVLDLTNFESNDVNLNGLRIFIAGTALLAQGNYEKSFEKFNQEDVKISEMVDKFNLEKVISTLSRIIN